MCERKGTYEMSQEIIKGIINIVPYCIIKLYKNVNVKMSQKCKRRYEKAKK